VAVFDCDVGHSICIGCFVDYIEHGLNNRQFKEHRQYGYTMQCPGMKVCYNHWIMVCVCVLSQLDVRALR